MSESKARGWRRPVAIRLVTVGVSVALTVAVVEVVLRLMSERGSFYPYRKNSVTATYPSEEITRGVSGVAYFTTNGFGCRGPELTGQQHRMLVIGGSTTACTVLDDDEAWPQLVMDFVNEHFHRDDFLWVANSGMDGRNTRHHMMHVKYLAPQIPALEHVLIYCGFNDLGRWLVLDEDEDQHFRITPETLAETVPHSFAVSDFNDPRDAWHRRLEIWKLASNVKLTFASRRLAATRAEGGIVQDDQLRWLENERQRRKQVKARTVPATRMATLDDALDAYGENLTAIVQLVRDVGSEPIFMAQAMQRDQVSEEDERDMWVGAMDHANSYVQWAQLQELVDKYNDRMESVAQKEKVVFIPAPKLLEGKQDLFYDSIHFHEAGARELARAVADFLIEHVYNRTDSTPAQ
jgi:lysophospholipase L1-like esterase